MGGAVLAVDGDKGAGAGQWARERGVSAPALLFKSGVLGPPDSLHLALTRKKSEPLSRLSWERVK